MQHALFRLTAVLLATFGTVAHAQSSGTEDDSGLWFMYAADGRFERGQPNPGPWRWWFDGQGRFLDDSDGYDQLLLRPAIGYDLAKDTSAWLGYAFVHDHRAVGPSTEEHRIWQQFLWTPQFANLGFQSRTRLEQRFQEDESETSWRFRQFVKVTRPFTDPKVGLAAYEEVFFNLNETDWADDGFAQNRLFLGLFWKLGPTITTEVGYLNQFIENQGAADRMNHILSLNLFMKFL